MRVISRIEANSHESPLISMLQERNREEMNCFFILVDL